MCGIAGILNFQNGDIVSREALDVFSDKFKHRGPDGHGFMSYDTSTKTLQLAKEHREISLSNLCLYHRRLSIVDLSDNGWQPMTSDDNNIVIVFNGEIYNYVEIAKELAQKGHTFKSTGDTAVIIAAYKEWGQECLNRFVGMFSFCLLDKKNNILFCARDFFGIKPFHYTINEKRFAFASEQKALLAAGMVRPKMNAAMVYDYIAYGEQEGGNNSFYKDIMQLPPAHFMLVDLDKRGRDAISIQKYWSISEVGHSKLSEKDATDELRNLFLESVSMHMRSDVPIAANLSGGIDSSSIVMAMRLNEPNDLDLHTISYIADYARVSEEHWIDIVNTASKSKPHKITPKAADLASELDELIYAQDEPFGSTSPYAQFKVFEAIKSEGIKVVLDGQGADELLAGYHSYYFPRIRSLIAQKKYVQAFLLSKNAGLTKKLFSNNIPLGRIYSKVQRSVFGSTNTDDISKGIFNESYKAISDIDRSSKHAATAQFQDPENKLLEVLHLTFTETSLPHLLRVADRNSMHHSVESRLPFLTPHMAKLILSLPEKFILDNDAITKGIFRKSMHGITPQAVLNRRDKIGFSTPEKEWLLSLDEWVQDLFNSDFAKKNPVLNQNRLISDWQNLKDNNTAFDWSFWRKINLLRWMEINGIEIAT